ncbi:MAG: hypothetical protein IT449_17225 [Phycisphaerales bacterium]|nr:hypothetical protein [Phycisphaerales bacterium]
MGRQDHKQLVLTLAAILALASGGVLTFRYFRNPSSPAPLARQLVFIDVTSGERMDIDLQSIRVIPAKNPKTGQRTLIPCGQNADGKWVVDAHYRDAVSAFGEANRYVDPKSLEVKASP